MDAPALTHHEIIALVEPFTRRARQVDLAASQRLQRRLAFKPVEHPADAAGTPALRETLWLDNPSAGHYTLTRLLDHPCGLQASLQAEGPEPGALLAQIEAVPAPQQFLAGPGYVIALAQSLQRIRVPRGQRGAAAAAAAPPHRVLTHASAQVDGLSLKMRVPAVQNIPAEIEITAAPGDSIELPEDLLAVLGWSWSRLSLARGAWRALLRLRGSNAARSQDAQHKLQRTLAHLARTLAEPPARFHQRLLRQRWAVSARRGIPLAGCVLLIAGAASVGKLNLSPDSVWRMLIFNAPPILLVALFTMRELPRVEIPPLPRASSAPSWRKDAPPAAPDTA